MHGCFALFLALKSFSNEPKNGQKKEEHTAFLTFILQRQARNECQKDAEQQKRSKRIAHELK